MGVTPWDLELNVEELVMEGVDPAHHEAVAEAMRAELAILIARRGLASALLAGGGARRLDGGSLTLPPGLAPADLGRRIAHAVAGGLSAPSADARGGGR
ncbi:MAG: hypothetical protein JWM27_3309 [Gemmatimonadetes bacterium]|nr:hypothetical protein [Gemmatimonadota bacterium]